MKTKNTYIKFKEWDKESLQKAVDIAEKYWATKWYLKEALKFEWTWILEIGEDNEYLVPNITKEELIEDWYTEFEIKIEESFMQNHIEQENKKIKDYIKSEGKRISKNNFEKTYNQLEQESYIRQCKKDQLIEFNNKPLEEKMFYYCFIPWNGEPVEKQQTLYKAEIEAKRLAKKTWKRVFILQALKSYKVSEIIETNYNW